MAYNSGDSILDGELIVRRFDRKRLFREDSMEVSQEAFKPRVKRDQHGSPLYDGNGDEILDEELLSFDVKSLMQPNQLLQGSNGQYEILANDPKALGLTVVYGDPEAEQPSPTHCGIPECERLLKEEALRLKLAAKAKIIYVPENFRKKK